ncbi:hypothetical protein C4J81_16815 [Deltaproteobacteria bacterium Smac51]|nr:hypothetical protein C4J81_16815 [Deltaproteobacteria bacterium Smac51]
MFLPGGSLVGFHKGWKACLAEWEPEAEDCFYPASGDQDFRNRRRDKNNPPLPAGQCKSEARLSAILKVDGNFEIAGRPTGETERLRLVFEAK